MASPSPNSPPSEVPTNSTTSSPPSSSTSPPPITSSMADQTSDPPSPSSNASSPPPRSPQTPTAPPSPPPSPPPSSAPPPSPPISPPPSPPTSPSPSPPLSSQHPSPPESPPPSPPESPPPSPPKSPTPSPPESPPPSPLTSPSQPPPTSTPPSPLTSPSQPPPTSTPLSPPSPVTSPPPPDLSPPPSPPSDNTYPPQSNPSPNPTPPDATPPPPKSTAPSPPPLKNVPTPPSSNTPPPPATEKSLEKSPPPPVLTPSPSGSQSAPSPPSTSSPSELSPPSPSVPSSSAPPTISAPGSPSNSSGGSPGSSSLPFNQPAKPTAKTADGTNVTAKGSSAGRGGLGTGESVAIAAVVGVLVLSVVFMAVWFVQRKRRRKGSNNIPYAMPSPFASSQNSDSFLLRSHSPVPLGSRSGSEIVYSSSEVGGVSNSRGFTYEELIQTTNGFSAQNLLGKGGFGCVYKGTLADGREVAVKQLKIGGGQGEREFRAEVEIISRVHHRHLVSLVGYCISEYQRLLVYDYVPNNTLHYHLHGGNGVLGWSTRVRIAAGAARGIAYLHEDCHPRIIHRDIKSSNILLDINFEAQVADFGLAKLASDTHTHVTTRVMGTFGYMAPEYATSGKLTDKSDVYSFGVVLLELITGRKPVDASQPLGDESLVEWARPLLAQALEDGTFEGLVDPKLDKNYVDTELFRMIEAAAACVRHSVVKRPRMSQVVRALDSLDEMSDLANGVKPGQSGVFDSAQQSAQIRMFQRMAFGSQDYGSEFFDWRRSQSSWRSREFGDQSPATSISGSRLWNN